MGIPRACGPVIYENPPYMVGITLGGFSDPTGRRLVGSLQCQYLQKVFVNLTINNITNVWYEHPMGSLWQTKAIDGASSSIISLTSQQANGQQKKCTHTKIGFIFRT